MKILKFADRLLEYSFYLTFFLVPLVFTNDTSELFEFNKMWLTFALTIVISASWITKMIGQKRFYLKRTPLDIPIALFLLSQIISTIFSIDVHTSLWGYYTRFNGGLLSIVSYIILYYAFTSNMLTEKYIKRLLNIGLASGVLVALWGLPSHFGYDPTCLLFRGNFDVSCWTADFQPKLRIFSTFGQPNWLAAYLNILIPISLSLAITNFTEKINKKFITYSLITFLFFLDLLFTRSQSGFLAFAVSFLVFAGFSIWKEPKKKEVHSVKNKIFTTWLNFNYFFNNPFKQTVTVYRTGVKEKLLLAFLSIVILITFFVGSPIDKLNGFTFSSIKSKIEKQKAPVKVAAPSTIPALELNITDSGTIRSIVWKGALKIWQHYPIFGSGVETFAYSYYKYRPVEHNLTSEWNYLYNKAHNEYLNFLATTGAFGFLTYMSVIFYFLYISFKILLKKWNGITLTDENKFLTLSLLSAFISILVTNFFGFSVVMINIFFFLIPVFALNTLGIIDDKYLYFPKVASSEDLKLRKIAVLAVAIVAFYFLFILFRFWNADKAYYMGSNLDRVQDYQSAYPYLFQAVTLRKSEPTFQDEFSVNNAVLAATLMGINQSKDASEAAKTKPIIDALLQSAITTSDNIVREHPNNVIFWKGRVRVFYSLAQIDPQYIPYALDAIKKAQALAPTDPTISYNLGILQGQNGDFDTAINTLENTIKLKSDYKDAYFGLGLFYHQKAVDKNGKVIDQNLQDKAVTQMKYILEKLDPNDPQAQGALSEWNPQ